MAATASVSFAPKAHTFPLESPNATESFHDRYQPDGSQRNGNGVANGESSSSAESSPNANANGFANGRPSVRSHQPSGIDPRASLSSDSPAPDYQGRQRVSVVNSMINGIAPDEHEFDLRPGHSHRVEPPGIHGQDPGGPRSRSHANIRSYTDDVRRGRYPRISKPVELLRSSYDVVVIGSGYGGGVAASRMARTGQSVCLLERGREKWPGEYPSGTVHALPEVHYSGDFAPTWIGDKVVEGGDPTGMYHLIFGKGQNAIVCNGLGGTSLMNANVYMEADPDTLAMPFWPDEIREEHALTPYYEKVRKVLQPEQYPDDWPKLPKVELLKKQAEFLGWGHRWHKTFQTTRFQNGVNSCGVEMSPSALTGQDATGVNDGSKTTTLVTYLADAWNWGADMFCECEVRYIEKAKDREGYIIYFAWHGRNRGHFKTNLHGDLMWVHAKKAVFLGAGAIGTTEILLRSKAMGLAMSSRVGQEMSGNGDMIAFGYNTDYEVNAIGRPFPSPYNPVGPCISSVIDCRMGHDNPLDGFVIEEGTIPAALAPVFQFMLDVLPGSTLPKSDASLITRTRHAFARYGSRILGPYFKKGAVERTQVYLIMSHDSNQAMLHLKQDKPVLEFLGVGRSDHINYLNRKLQEATEAVGGELVQNPFSALLGQQQLTVHPIGGACMARDNTGSTGVVNHAGRLLKGSGSETYDGIIVTDGAVVPCALGANPLATISALAERSLDHYIRDNNLTLDEESNGILDLFGEPKHSPQRRTARQAQAELDVEVLETESLNSAREVIVHADLVRASGFGFTEVMAGFIHNDPGMNQDYRSTYERAYYTAKNLCESARFFLSVQAFNTKTIISEPDHRGMLTGTFVCPTIPGSPFMVQRGEFNLFILDHKAPGTRNLAYDFDMTGINGQRLHFHGYKVVDSSVALAPMQFWRSTSTLYVTISECPDPEHDIEDEDAWRTGKVVGKGIMHIQPTDFLSEVLTLTPTGSSLLKRVWSAANFLTFFTRKSMSLFLSPLTPLQYPSQTYTGYINSTPPSESWAVEASDKVSTRLHMWEPTHYPDNDPANIRNLFMIPGASVDHQIFALPTIPYNAVNYFTRAGYRVFVTVHRIGELMIAENNWTTYDARLDLRACLEHIRRKYGEHKVYTIAHCMGSVAFACGLLDGTIPAEWIKGVTCSQVFMNPIWNTLNMIKVMAGPVPVDKLYKWLCGSWFSCSTSKDDSLIQKGLNELLRFMPDERRELCNNASCHRTTLVFGRCWNHRNLNEATHRQIDRFFGGVNLTLLHLLMKQGFEGHVMGNAPLYHDLTSPRNIQRLKGIPFLLFVGGDNAVLSPMATEKTYEILCDTFGSRVAPPAHLRDQGHDGGRGSARTQAQVGVGSQTGGVAGVSDVVTGPVANGVPPASLSTATTAASNAPAPSALSSSSAAQPTPTPEPTHAHTASGGRDGILYRRRVVPGYGHLDCWMGRHAWKDVYPFVREEVDRVCRGEDYRFVEPDDKFKAMVENGELLY